MEHFWEKPGWQEKDKHLVALGRMPFRRPFPKISLKKGFYTLRGPRQIGKSSWLKTMLYNSCKKYGAHKVFFNSCENISDYKELNEILKIYQKRQFLFLDEITFIKDWYRPVKHLIDSGYNGVIAVTGSTLVDLRKGADRLPGREGEGLDFKLLPMDFEEFLKAWGDAGFEKISRLDALEKYLKIGGFPIALAEAKSNSTKILKTEKIIEKWIIGDILKFGYQEAYAKDLMSQIAQTMTTPLSANKLSSRTQIGSHHTVNQYISLLEDLFAIRTLYSIDPDTGAFRFKKEKKYYFTDPVLVRISMKWLGLSINDIENSILAEMVVHEFLRRRFEHLGFLSSKKMGEVDFYAYKKWAIELKWSTDIKNLSKLYKDLVLPFKRVWTQENIFKDLPGEKPVCLS